MAKVMMMVMTAFFILPFGAMAEECGTTPYCSAIGYPYSKEDCGTYARLKCPFGEAYFCTYCDEANDDYVTCPDHAICEFNKRNSGNCMHVTGCDEANGWYSEGACPEGWICTGTDSNCRKATGCDGDKGYIDEDENCEEEGFVCEDLGNGCQKVKCNVDDDYLDECPEGSVCEEPTFYNVKCYVPSDNECAEGYIHGDEFTDELICGEDNGYNCYKREDCQCNEENWYISSDEECAPNGFVCEDLGNGCQYVDCDTYDDYFKSCSEGDNCPEYTFHGMKCYGPPYDDGPDGPQTDCEAEGYAWEPLCAALDTPIQVGDRSCYLSEDVDGVCDDENDVGGDDDWGWESEQYEKCIAECDDEYSNDSTEMRECVTLCQELYLPL